jgi:hypothetical protein
MAKGADPVERDALESFLTACKMEYVPRPATYASAMSAADNEALTLAVRVGADYLLCDERVTRTVADAEGIRPLGTLGILLRAMHAGTRTHEETCRAVDPLVSSHGFRIGFRLYQAVLGEIGRGVKVAGGSRSSPG